MCVFTETFENAWCPSVDMYVSPTLTNIESYIILFFYQEISSCNFLPSNNEPKKYAGLYYFNFELSALIERRLTNGYKVLEREFDPSVASSVQRMPT